MAEVVDLIKEAEEQQPAQTGGPIDDQTLYKVETLMKGEDLVTWLEVTNAKGIVYFPIAQS